MDMPSLSFPGSDKNLPTMGQTSENSIEEEKRVTIAMRESLLQTQINSFVTRPRYASPVREASANF